MLTSASDMSAPSMLFGALLKTCWRRFRVGAVSQRATSLLLPILYMLGLFLGAIGIELVAAETAPVKPLDAQFTFHGTATPVEFEVRDPAMQSAKRGFAFPALLPGKLQFTNPLDQELWSNPTKVLHFKHGEEIARIADPDLDAELSADRGRLVPLHAELDRMRRIMQQTPAAMASLRLILKEGEAVLLEADIRERELERAVKKSVVSPADAEIIELSLIHI